MRFVVQFVVSLAILLWGVAMIVLGVVDSFFLWVAIGIAVAGVGLPLLGSHPWVSGWLYPTSGDANGTATPAPEPPAGS